jgi:hypothetical protein
MIVSILPYCACWQPHVCIKFALLQYVGWAMIALVYDGSSMIVLMMPRILADP